MLLKKLFEPIVVRKQVVGTISFQPRTLGLNPNVHTALWTAIASKSLPFELGNTYRMI